MHPLLLLLALAFPSVQWEKDSHPAGGAKGFVELPNGDVLATHTAHGPDGVRVIASRSTDGGLTWHDDAVIVRDEDPATDLGDGCLLSCADGTLLYSYRCNRYRGRWQADRTYAIRVAASTDGGKTWQPHSTVQEVRRGGEGFRGLWASALLQTSRGAIQCIYDDENAALVAGFPRHQWLTMKTWDPEARAWVRPVTVSRAHDPAHLSRDGMPSAVELPGGRLLCVLESVAVERPHPNVVRCVTSDDGGATWSWQREERAVVYQAPKAGHMAVSPWVTRLSSGALACVFATDEDRDTPDRPGCPVPEMHMDVKAVFSSDNGRTWSSPAQSVYTENHGAYMPGIAEVRRGPRPGLLVLLADTRLGSRGVRGAFRR